MSEKKSINVRLAIREEGEWVNAYLAHVGTMDGSILIGSILKGIVEKDTRLWEQWKSVMTAALQMGIEEISGMVPEMVEQAAPPHERAGNA